MGWEWGGWLGWLEGCYREGFDRSGVLGVEVVWWLSSGDGGGGQVVGDVCVGLGRLLDELGELLHELGDGEHLGA